MTDTQTLMTGAMTAEKFPFPPRWVGSRHCPFSLEKRSLEPKKNISYETFKFRQTSQKDDEIVIVFHSRLRAILCDFQDVDKNILAQIIQGCTLSRICRKALKDNLDLEKILEDAPNLELSDSKAAAIETAAAANAISSNVNACNASYHNRVRWGHRGHHYRGSSHSGSRSHHNGHHLCTQLTTPGPSHRNNTHRRGGSRYRGRITRVCGEHSSSGSCHCVVRDECYTKTEEVKIATKQDKAPRKLLLAI